MQKAIKLSPNFSSIRQSLSKTQNSKIKKKKIQIYLTEITCRIVLRTRQFTLASTLFHTFYIFLRIIRNLCIFKYSHEHRRYSDRMWNKKNCSFERIRIKRDVKSYSNRNERIMKICRMVKNFVFHVLCSQDCTRRTTRRNQRQSGNSFEEGFFFPLFLTASPPGPAAACKRVAHVCKSICTRVCMRPGKGNRPAAVGSLLDNDTARASGTCLTRSSLSPFPSSSSLSRSLLFFFPFLGEVCTPSFLCILSIHHIGYGCSRISNRSLAANDCCIVGTRSWPLVINYSDEYVCLRVIKTLTLCIFRRSTLREIKR